MTAGRAREEEEEERVRRKCAWCGRDLGVKEAGANRESGAAAPAVEQPNGDKCAEDTEVTSTICPRCAGALAAYRKPVLVVSREWARMYEDLVEMLKERPDIQIVIYRRQPENEGTEENGWKGPERRRKKDPFTLK